MTVCIVIFVISAEPCNGGMEWKYFPVNNHCYKEVNNSYNFSQGRSNCEEQGANMVSIGFPAEQDFLSDKVLGIYSIA